jgi:hypothetical protein
VRYFLLAIALASALVAAVLAGLQHARTVPTPTSWVRWHYGATHGADVAFAGAPLVHPVLVPPVPGTIADDVLDTLAGQQQQDVLAVFEPGHDWIVVVDRQARLQAELPYPLQSDLRRGLRHEYGRAMLQDWLIGKAGETEGRLLSAETVTSRPVPHDFPPELQPVIDDYMSYRPTIYGDIRYMASLNDYVAESYERFLEGEYVPPRTRLFLAAVAAGR